MNTKNAPNFAGGSGPKLCLGGTSDRKFGFWDGGKFGFRDGGMLDSKSWCRNDGFGDGDRVGGWFHDGWMKDVHSQSYSIDINTLLPLNGPSSRLIPCSQDINPMLRIIKGMSPPEDGDYPGPPERGRGPLSRLRPGARRGKGPARHEVRTPGVRVWFPRHNSDSRQDVYAMREMP